MHKFKFFTRYQEPAQRLPQLAARTSRGVADRRNPGIRHLVVRVDAATFERIARSAATADVTTSEAVRQLIKRGLDGARP